MKIRHIIYITAVAAMMSGCSLYKDYDPAVTVRSDLYGAQVTEDTVSMASLHWNEFYTDSHLQAIIQHALDNNPSVKIAQLNITKAQASLKASRMAYLPTVGLSAVDQFNSSGKSTSNSFCVAAVGQWSIPSLGAIPNRKKQAEVLVEQAMTEQQAVKTSLVNNVAAEYYNLLMLDRQLVLTRQTIGLWNEALTTMRALYDVGMYYSPAVTQMEASIEELQVNMVDLEQSIHSTEVALCLLMGDVPHEVERGSLDDFTMPRILETGVPAMLLQHRPDVRQAERDMAVAYYSTQIARSAFYPGVDLKASLGWGFDVKQFVSELVGSVFAPVFQSGKLKANLKISEAEQEQARLAFEKTLLKAGNEVATAMYDCKVASRKEQHIRRQIELYDDAVKGTKVLMNNGKANYLEVIQSQESLLSAQMQEIENRASGINALINLYTALGGF